MKTSRAAQIQAFKRRRQLMKEIRVVRICSVAYHKDEATMRMVLETNAGLLELLLPIEGVKAWMSYLETGSTEASQAASLVSTTGVEFPDGIEKDGTLVLLAETVGHGRVYMFVEKRDPDGELIITLVDEGEVTKH
jgi:hypothetical protein